MVLQGVSIGSGTAFATDFAGNSVSVRSRSFGVSCRRTVTPEEVCEAAGAQAAANKKLSYDEGWRDIVLGVGYLAWIVPGVIFFFVFRAQSDTLAGDAESERQTVVEDCVRTVAERPRARHHKEPSVEVPPAEATPPQPAAVAPAPSGPAGCQYDTQCKGDRICRDGRCIDPTAPTRPSATPDGLPAPESKDWQDPFAQ